MPTPIISSTLIHEVWQWDEARIKKHQLDAFNCQMSHILPSNKFYRDKLGQVSYPLESLDQLQDLPFTTKAEIVSASEPDDFHISTHHTYPRERYSRLHRTSGTTGQPLLIFDTKEDWHWWSNSWQHVLEAGRVSDQDRVFLAFSFGPFIGFWSAHQACVDRGATVIPGGGLSSIARLEFLRQSQANVLCCTPSYALHLAEIARKERFPIDSLSIRLIIVAGEPGGSIPAVRKQIENDWNAKVIDHSGATEIGAWGFGWPDRCGLHINEQFFVPELIPFDRSAGEPLFELVLTSLGRYGCPLIRYRTGDLVRDGKRLSNGCNFLWFSDGIVGRADDMVIIRGVNVFPSSIDAIVREHNQIVEYRVTIERDGQLDQLSIELEGSEEAVPALVRDLTLRLGLRIPVQHVSAGSLPRSEAKSKRWIDKRHG